MKRYRSMVAGAAVVMVMSGCGGGGGTGDATGSDGESTTTKVASKTEFVTQANARCAELEKKLDEVQDGAEYNDTPEGTAAAADKMAELTDKALGDIKALPQPSEDPATLTAMYDGLTEGIQITRDLGKAAAAKDKAKTGELAVKLETHMEGVNAKATAYGLAECAKS